MIRSEQVAVIGGGISGFTTALLLRKFGYEVTIYSEKFPSSSENDPLFGSLYPAASIIPHSVYHRDANNIFEESQQFFSYLLASNFPGLTTHRHFELFAFDNTLPNYSSSMNKFKSLDQIDWMPAHPEIKIQSGWEFECFFADWPFYFPAIIKAYLKNDGIFITKKINFDDIQNIKEDIIINCSGTGSIELENDSASKEILLGHLLKIQNQNIPKDPNGKPISYNFSPGTEFYSNNSNEALDVYFYPGKENWVLGGSRFHGTLINDGSWSLNGNKEIEFPSQIEELNSEILRNTFDIEIDEQANRSYHSGIRYIRNQQNGLRLEKEILSNKTIFHNYGNGGAGVTLSWGCAFRILNMIQRHQGSASTSIDETIEKIQNLNS